MLYLKEIRMSREKTQSEVASFLKIARASYANLENGKRDPDTQTLLSLADYFDVSMDALFGRDFSRMSGRTAEENTLLRLYDRLSDEGKRRIISNMKFLIQEQEEEDKRKKGITA